MKIVIKYSLLFALLFNCNCGIYPADNKNNSLQNVSAINSEILSKYIFRLQVNSCGNSCQLEPVDISEDNESIKNDPFLKVFYVDKNNQLRKFIENSQFAEGGTHIIEYFNKDGSLCCIFYEVSFLSEFNSYGAVSIMNKRITKINSYYEDLSKSGKNKVLLNVIPSDGRIKIHKSVNDLKKHYFIKNINFSEISSFGRYAFRKPIAADETYINAYSVIIRDKPNRNSNELYRCNPLQKLIVLGVDREERIEPYGLFNWYEVRLLRTPDRVIEGFVFGAFLETVEIKVSE
ncbi:MAG: hypothetical protein KBH06_10660 [Spirochaetes bacterium]|nr:hypothetical protein [Spirochaetota bacterium]